MTKNSVALSLVQTLNPAIHLFICKIENCNTVLKGKKKWNLVNHFENKHSSIFREKMIQAAGRTEKTCGLEQRRLEQIQNLTKTVTVNGRPFKCLVDSGTSGLRARELKLLQDSGYGEGLTGDPPPAVMTHIEYLSSEVIDAIKLEVQNSFVSLMVDAGSKNKRDMLGVSMQYMRNGQVMIRSIGMILLTTSHTAENLNAEIIACLRKFNIKPSQVISITSDNASNMLATVKLFNRTVDSDCDGNDSIANNDNSDNDDIEQSEDCFKSADIYDDNFITEEIKCIIEEFNSIHSMNSEELREADRREAEIQEILDDSSYYIDLLKLLENSPCTH